MKDVSVKMLSGTLQRMKEKPVVIIIDEATTNFIIASSEDIECKIVVVKNFSITSNKLQMLTL